MAETAAENAEPSKTASTPPAAVPAEGGEEKEDGEISPRKGEARLPSPEVSKKHLLENEWTLWFDNPNGRQRQTTWGNSLRSVYTFGTVEDFWCLFNNVVQPSRLIHGADFHCFKKGIEPKWEDPKCTNGGRWNAQVPKGRPTTLDTYWLHTLLAMIGEQFADGEEVCGAVVSVRVKQDRIAIWTKTASNESAQMSIGRQWKEVLDFGDQVKIGYVVHEDAKKLDKRAKDRYTV
eukprot:TRINITY_DN2558_c0_g1_i1.p1 TRINITY_DN2558_c0_g1~~TRINITY_DN2558_c0_g1_i1.p1  ORF type:complete len:234 (-),score=41.83 TRINITY_DN2558_c0_g1_i1:208-909(-)